MAELADAPALGAGGLTAVGVRVPSSAPNFREVNRNTVRDGAIPFQIDGGEKMKRIQELALMLAVVALAGFTPSALAQGGTPAPATQVTVSPSPNPVSDTLRTLVALCQEHGRRGRSNARGQIRLQTDASSKLPSRTLCDTSRSQILDCARELATTAPPHSDRPIPTAKINWSRRSKRRSITARKFWRKPMTPALA